MDSCERYRLLSDILRIPTVNGTGNERKLAESIRSYFQKYSIPADVVPIEDGLANVQAEIRGSNPDRFIAVNGHLDTVPYGDPTHWDTDPSVPVVKDGRVYARGASDMKSGLAALIAALCQIQASGIVPRRTIRFLGTADEEKTGKGALAAERSNWIGKPDILIIGEPTNGQIGAVQKGCLWLKFTIKGKTAHSAYPERGTNAITAAFTLGEKLISFVNQFSHLVGGRSSGAMTRLSGGIASNLIPDTCEMTMDFRSVPGLTDEMIFAQIQQSIREISNLYSDISVTYEIMNRRKLIESDPSHPEIHSFRQVAEAVQRKSIHSIGISYFTDASILMPEKATFPVILFGPGDPDMAHQPNEFVRLDSYDLAIQTFYDYFLS